jgi:hypothetical protein
MAAESYVRVLLEDGANPFAVQRKIGDVDRYIGSYVVDVERLDGGSFDPFDVIAGFNGTTGEVDSAIEQVRGIDGVVEVRDFRNNRDVPPAIGVPGLGDEQG